MLFLWNVEQQCENCSFPEQNDYKPSLNISNLAVIFRDLALFHVIFVIIQQSHPCVVFSEG